MYIMTEMVLTGITVLVSNVTLIYLRLNNVRLKLKWGLLFIATDEYIKVDEHPSIYFLSPNASYVSVAANISSQQ